MTTFYTVYNKREASLAITGETHTIPLTPTDGVYRVILNEFPYETTGIAISGFMEVIYPISPSARQFSCDYRYGFLYFHGSNSGDPISVAYNGLGSNINADIINAIQTAISALERSSGGFFPIYIAGELTETEGVYGDGWVDGNSVEGTPMPIAVTFSAAYINCRNIPIGSSVTIAIHNLTQATSETITLPANNMTYYDSDFLIAFAVGDKLSVKIISGSACSTKAADATIRLIWSI